MAVLKNSALVGYFVPAEAISNETHRTASMDEIKESLVSRKAITRPVFDVGASYAAAISQAHCFNDGNKRTAFQVLDVVLDLNGVQMAWDTQVIGQKIVLLAQSKLDDINCAEWLRPGAV